MLARLRHWRLAAHLLVWGVWCFVTLVTVRNGGLHGPNLLNYPVLIVLSGWMLGGRATVVLVAITGMLFGLFFWAEAQGWMPQVPRGSRWAHGVYLAGILVLTAAATLLSRRNYMQRVQEAQRTAHELAASESQLRKLLRAVEQSPESIVITDLQERIEYVNEAFVQRTGYVRQEVLGHAAALFSSKGMEAAQRQGLRETLASGKVWAGEQTNQRKDGAPLAESVVVAPIRQTDGSISHYVEYRQDITERKRAAQEIHRLARHDALTGLPNRAMLVEHLHGLQERADGSPATLHALLLLDLDRFTVFNDARGSEMGDRLLCAMAQCGFLIPADERSEICVFDEFLVDIGDEQSIEQSLSTFSGHMKKITGILELAMPHTLVLLDELGAGTDPAEGAALAVAIIEELRRRGVLLMATTHYAELKVFALETKGVVNASCEFDLETLRPTYKLSVGVPGKSNAFLISEKLGIPERVIEAAQQHLSAEDKRLDAVLGQLDDLKLQLKESQNEVEELKNEASHQLEAAQKKRDELIRQGENELEAARAKARALAQQVESQAYALTDELRQLQKDERMSTQQKAQRAREIAKKESEKLFIGSEAVHNPVKEFVPLKEVKVGQEVCIAELNQLATVLALPDKNGDVLVRAGIIKTKVPLKGLKQPEKLVKEKKPQTKAQQRYSRLTGDANRPNGRVERVQRSAKMECNLLGLTVDEALPEVDSFIDRAILNGQTVVYLIHGNGTGALRTAIHKHLRGNRMVKSFRLGRYGEGESGVTVVELK